MASTVRAVSVFWSRIESEVARRSPLGRGLGSSTWRSGTFGPGSERTPAVSLRRRRRQVAGGAMSRLEWSLSRRPGVVVLEVGEQGLLHLR